MDLAPVGLCIHSYELDDNHHPSITLSHIFWGNTIDEAIQVASSHLMTDFFFHATFIGELKWKKDTILITYHGEWMGTKKISNKQLIKAFHILEKRAVKLHHLPEHKKALQSIHIISNKKF